MLIYLWLSAFLINYVQDEHRGETKDAHFGLCVGVRGNDTLSLACLDVAREFRSKKCN